MIKVNDKLLQKKIDAFYACGQGHVFRFWGDLNREQRDTLLSQIKQVDLELMERLYDDWRKREQKGTSLPNLEPAEIITLDQRLKRDAEARAIGEQALSAGKLAAFLVAGGQGSRLGFDGPKGAFRITPVKQKTLFQLHAEKIKAVSLSYKTVIPWYIMTSQANHRQTVRFFEQQDYFGLEKANVIFFSQEMLPAMDKNGKLLLADKNRLFMSPNGHGGSIKALWDSGALADMKRRNIAYLFYFQVDNALTRICDPAFIGYHILHESEMSGKVVRKRFPEEKMGVICKINGKTGLVEYSDLDEKNMRAKESDGSLRFWAGSIATHVINVDFLWRENEQGFRLPYHFAEKAIPYVDEKGKPVKPEDKNGLKFETFVFDALQDVRSTVTVEVERDEEFSALKNKEGLNSPKTVVEDLLRLYARWLRSAGVDIPVNKTGLPAYNIEISPLFALEAEDVQKKRRQIPQPHKNMYLE